MLRWNGDEEDIQHSGPEGGQAAIVDAVEDEDLEP